jgi:hypothetical protein
VVSQRGYREEGIRKEGSLVLKLKLKLKLKLELERRKEGIAKRVSL